MMTKVEIIEKVEAIEPQCPKIGPSLEKVRSTAPDRILGQNFGQGAGVGRVKLSVGSDAGPFQRFGIILLWSLGRSNMPFGVGIERISSLSGICYWGNSGQKLFLMNDSGVMVVIRQWLNPSKGRG